MSSRHDFCFTPEAYRPKITHRVLRNKSQITRETFEENDAREQRLLNRKFAKYRVNAAEQFHNQRPLMQGRTFWDNWKIVDRGKGKIEPAKEYQPFNPILNTLDNYPKPPPSRRGRVKQAKADVNPVFKPWRDNGSSAPDPIIPQTCASAIYSQSTPSRNGRERYGDYDPIRCQWIVEPENDSRRDAAGYLPLKGRRHITGRPPGIQEQQVGYLFERRAKKRTPLPAEQGVYDPIRNAWLVLPQSKRICEGQSFAPVPKYSFR